MFYKGAIKSIFTSSSQSNFIMKFDDYSITAGIKTSLAKLGYRRPTDIQFKSIPPILKGEDVLAIAQTGTGKTAAFAIPVIHQLHTRKTKRRADGIKCLVMVPTRELAIQIHKVFETIGKHTSVKSFCVFGGVEEGPQIAKLEKGVDILIATPGRMFDLASRGFIKLHRTEILILDEADHMLDLGFIKDIRDLMSYLPKKRQTLFFSATINDVIKKLAYSLVSNAIRIQVSPKDPVARNIDHSVTFIEMDDKRFFLERLIKENPESKILVFVRTKVRCERVEKAMERVGIPAKSLHGGMQQDERNKVFDLFRKGEVKVLIATDVSARGIDIPLVEFVVNYDLPDLSENYVHRVGRTGRAKEKGQAVTFCSEEEKKMLTEIEGFLGQPIKRLEIDKDDYSQTIDFSAESHADWKTLINEHDDMLIHSKSSKRKKKKTK
ncbi:ATP-dependent RNA helicase RhlE [Saccharicrinis carchari]|uniref:ATP-dependent RNA helicase RhlE n=1 Tax=Saccharicrinis carchari TaxID=1168039 RepID=A0A521BYL4_SACCC|nr:DEAD/DEAH box helicase [Saccharicrinis carchari]SMO52277.1 ATP-dependent RNA helicase RhlE [Saccharicrinis carchari]